MGGTGQSLKATNAIQIDNMNEMQLKREIKKAENKIESLNDRMRKNLQSNSSNGSQGRAMQEAFPLGFGQATSKQVAAQGRRNERDAKLAVAYSDMSKEYDSTEKRLDNLNKALKEVKGTGKTVNQLKEEKRKATTNSTTINTKWKKGTFNVGGGFKGTEYTAGEYRITKVENLVTVYHNGQRLGATRTLADAKAYVERRKNRK